MGCAGFRQHMKINYRWVLEWPSMEPGFEDKQEIRKGVDVIHLKDGKIINSLTFTKTTLEIDTKRQVKISVIKIPAPGNREYISLGNLSR